MNINFENMKNQISQLKDFISNVDKINNEVLASVYNSDKMVDVVRSLMDKKAEIVTICKEFTDKYEILENHESLICVRNKMENELECLKSVSENDKDFIKSGVKIYKEFLQLLVDYTRSRDNSFIYPLVNKARQTVDIYEVIINKIENIQ